MGLIYMIRHAQASFGSMSYDRLSDLGIRQSEILGDYFARVGVNFDSVYSGAMERQRVTAETVLARTGKQGPESQIRPAPEFNEYDAHSIIESQIPDMRRDHPSVAEALDSIYTDGRALKVVFEWAMLRWVAGQANLRGIETWGEFKSRVARGIQRIATENAPSARVAIFTSGGAICAVMQMALGLSDEETIRLALQIRNTSVSAFTHEDFDPILVCFNSTAHLELENNRDLITYR